jgi:hypothetical protein
MTDTSPRVVNAALRLAIQALKDYRRRHFAIGHHAFMKGQVFTFTERDHLSYMKYSAAIETIEKIIKGELK